MFKTFMHFFFHFLDINIDKYVLTPKLYHSYDTFSSEYKEIPQTHLNLRYYVVIAYPLFVGDSLQS